jgi:hypothetical protein
MRNFARGGKEEEQVWLVKEEGFKKQTYVGFSNEEAKIMLDDLLRFNNNLYTLHYTPDVKRCMEPPACGSTCSTIASGKIDKGKMCATANSSREP